MLKRRLSAAMDERWLMFTYGTLKRGEPNHHVLQPADGKTAEFLGHATTLQPFPLLIASRYNIPFLLDAKGKGLYVNGELYSVNAAMLAAMDDLESHPDFYVRRQESVRLLSDPEKIVEAWIYFLPKWRPEMEERPVLESYSSAGPHGLPYVPSDDLERAEDIDL